MLAITDTRTHAVARELAGSAFPLTGTTARLDAPIIREGVVAGVVCHEHVGEARIWSQKDRDFAASTADMAALFLEHADRLEIELALRERRENKLVEDKMAALSRLARAVAHDINNVFNVLGMTGFLLEGSQDEDLRRHGESIQRAVGLGGRLVQQLALFGEETARQQRARRPRRPRGPDAAVLTDLAHGIRLEIAMLTPAPIIVANASQIEQVLLNLCVNAFESIAPSPDGRVRIELRDPHPGEAIDPASVVLSVAGQRSGHGRRDAGAHLRALLHAQGRRSRHRTVRRLRDREAVPRLHHRAQRTGRRRNVRHRAADGRGARTPALTSRRDSPAASGRAAGVPAHLQPARIAPRARGASVLQSVLRPRSLLLGALVAVVVAASGLWARHRLQREVERELAAELGAVLDTATNGLLGFMENCERLAGVIAESPEVRAVAVPAIALAGSAPPRETTLARAIAPYLAAGQFTGFVIADRRGAVLATSGAFGHVGDRLPPQVLPVEAAMRRGRPTVGLPFRDLEGRVRVLVAAPIRDAPAILGLLLDHRPFTASLLAARAGPTGETYAFDCKGLMISTSRFPQHLRAAGLLGPDEDDSALRVELRDPSGDLTTGYRSEVRRRDQPLTAMAAAATAGHDGFSVVAYRDYRGVPVVGAWRWLPDCDLGVASEIDAAQAFQPMRALERVFTALLALLALAGVGVVAGAAVAERARLRATSSEHEARRIGEYLIEQQIGGGAMGDVFLARHALLRRPTAVKVLRADRMSAEDISRFEREVQVTATLSHPNTIAIYDYGRTDDGLFYYAMEYLAGIDLDSLVSELRARARRARHPSSAPGLRRAGRRPRGRVVHRDVKLANLYLCARGGIPDVLKVLDFGLVKTDDAARVTRASVIVGTPENMAPELFESAANASPLTDIYALGASATRS